MPLTRRTLLKLVAASAPVLLLGCKGGDTDTGPFDPDAVPESTTLFPRTPICGDVRSTRAVIAFFVADDSPVVLRIWTETEVIVDEAIDPSGDGFHKVMIDELVPGTVYRYAVFDADLAQRGLIGRFRTPPSEGTLEPVTLALMSCIGQGTVLPDYYLPEGLPVSTAEPFQWEVFTHASEHEIDALVHLGDQGYLDYVWSEEDGTVEAYLHAWGFYHGGGYRDIYPLAPLYATLDDHESTDNSTFDPWDVTPEEAQKLANAMSAWYKVNPIDAMTPSDGPVWRTFRWGDTLELVLLDCRYELGVDHLMTEAQLAFLIDRIDNSPCRFVCVATPRPFANITASPPLAADNQDRWQAYPAQRQQVVEAIDARGGGVIFVAGDIHMNYLGRLSLDGTSVSDQAHEVCTTSGNVNPLAEGLSDVQFAFVDNRPHLPVLTFDPAAGTVHVAFYARDGSLRFETTLDDV